MLIVERLALKVFGIICYVSDVAFLYVRNFYYSLMVVFCCNSVNGVRVPAAELDSWICFVNTESRSVATLFISRLIDIGRHFGVRISPPHM